MSHNATDRPPLAPELNAAQALRLESTEPLGLRRYDRRDWLTQRPLVDAYKDIRHQLALTYLLRRKAPDDAAAQVRQRLRSRRAIVTIAFNDAEFTDWQARLIQKYVPDAVHVIADNSPRADASAAVAGAANRHGALYFRLPPNPWNGRAPARSHGFALTWVWHNVIRPGRPQAFGFVDHDIFPTAPADPFAPLDGHVAYGVARNEYGCRYLWPGFCFFRFDAITNFAPNFSPNHLHGLETGGMNWHRMYRHLSPGQIAWLDLVNEPLPDDASGLGIQRAGAWVHMAGVSWTMAGVASNVAGQQRDTKRRYIENLLARHLA